MDVKLEELRERIGVIREEVHADEFGNLIRSNARTLFTVWAFVLPYTGKLSNGFAETVADISYRVVIRYREDISITDHILWRNKKLEIAAPPYGLNGRRKYTILECRELVEDEVELDHEEEC